jgi:exodeoxyribonuclease V alpha subunit
MGAIKTCGIDDTIIGIPRKKDCINSTARVNEAIQDLLLPDEVQSIKFNTRQYKLGAKVIQRVNDYDKNVFNGDVGYITKIDDKSFTITFKADNEKREVVYALNEVDQIDLAYAMTIHSLQGSGYKAVIVIIDNTHYTLLDNCLLYTAITRAKKKCLLLAEPSAFQRCIKTNKTAARHTWLSEFIPF